MNVTCELSEPIAYVKHDSFGGDYEPRDLRPDGSIYADRDERQQLEIDGVGDFEALRDLPLLSADGEAFLFRKMNYFRHCAEQSRLKGLPEETVKALLDDAEAVRNHIAECNLRLVISIARKFTASGCDFDDLMSEGNEILLKAISKFDFSRGYRFSTYATHSVQRHFFRYTQRVRKRNQFEYKSSVELLNELPESEQDSTIQTWIREEQRMTALVSRMAERLDSREHQIVVGRFGLATDGVCRTLRELSADLGLSKERIRQLQIVAVEKLRDLFDELDSELVSA